MINGLLGIFAPDYCYSCGKIGYILCESCVYDITDEPFGRCVECQLPTVEDNMCSACSTPVDGAWVVGERTGVLEKLVNDSKFSANRRACQAQATLLDRVLPRLDGDTIVVPIPTIWRHRRQRGFGHAEYVGRHLAKLRGLSFETSYLYRITDSVQHGSARGKRLRQAEMAFACKPIVNPTAPILVVDDVYTTGASIRAAATELRRAGATNVYAAITTRQILDG